MTVPAHAERGRIGRTGEVLVTSLRLGLTSFGGPIAHLGYFRREYVERRAWIDEHSYADLLALCQFLPGPASSQLGIAIGTHRAGIRGGLAAWLGFTLPSATVLVAFGLLTASVDLATAGWVHGLKLAAVAVVAQAVYAMARSLTPDWPRRIVGVVAALVAMPWATPFSQVAIIAAGALVGRFLLAPPPARSTGPEPSPVSRRLGLLSLGAFFALLIGLPLLRTVADSQPLALFDTFYRAGALVFGGGHVVLPLLHSSVVDPGWVPNDAFLAGYGAAQAVPRAAVHLRRLPRPRARPTRRANSPMPAGALCAPQPRSSCASTYSRRSSSAHRENERSRPSISSRPADSAVASSLTSASRLARSGPTSCEGSPSILTPNSSSSSATSRRSRAAWNSSPGQRASNYAREGCAA